MTIQFNTDKTIQGDDKRKIHFTTLIEQKLKRFNDAVTRIELHLSDENGEKGGPNDIRCLLEARIAGKQPIAVKEQAATLDQAVEGAVAKMETSLSKIFDKMAN